MAGSRHKDQCHWFINNEEIDALSRDPAGTHNEQTRLATLAQCMSTNQEKRLALEYIEAQPPQHQPQVDTVSKVVEFERSE
ncbi:hypothetical protein [Zooshikella sp. RANM57]|uniref:hypothetical protein n=1 Tax=Zooshikella sp. RANM57 TaxID=3425863 RepID=UPI003D6EE080